MNIVRTSGPGRRRCSSGVTLIEVVIAMTIAAITISSIVAGYIFSARQLEQSACASAAEFKARQRVEQARSAKWDPLADPPVDELAGSNFPVVISALDLPVAINNPLYGTNTTTITTVSTNPWLKMIRVDCVWSLLSRGPFTNTLTAYRAPDQ